MNKFHKLVAITALSLTAAFTYTCSSGGGGNDDPPPSSSSAATLAEAKTALNEAIAAADVAKESAEVSANGADVNPSDKWVTQSAMAALEDAIAAAQAAKSKSGATQAEIESATAALNAAVKAFNNAKKAGTNPGAPTKGELEAALAAAETAKDGAEVSADGSDVFTTDKWVTSEQMDILANQIAAAKAVKDNGSATQAEVDAAKAILQTATATFNNARQAGTHPLCGGSKYSLATQYCFNNTIQEYLFDSRDDKKYKTIVIGDQIWMAENLNHETETGSACYDNSDANCDKYGRLYDWATAMEGSGCTNTARCSTDPAFNHQGICPDGWHIPNDAEWDVLTNFVGTSAGKKLKSESDLWTSHATAGGTDEFGFAGLPGGYGFSSGSSFNFVGYRGFWWGATEFDASYAYNRYVSYDNGIVNRNYVDKAYLYSVRCVQD